MVVTPKAQGNPALAEPVVNVRRTWIGLLFAANLGLWMAYYTPLQVLLPEQIEDLGIAHKELWLGIVTGIGAIVAVVVNPLAGALSDRTRLHFLGRAWGRRHIWTAGAALLLSLCLLVLAVAPNLFWITVGWALANIGINVMLATLTSAVPDRVPVAQRGLVSGWIGMPVALGLVVGAILVTTVVTTPSPGYLIIAIGLLLLVAPFVLRTPDDPLGDTVVPRFTWRAFRVDMRANPDFAWAWVTRFLVMLGNALGTLYLLYFLSDAVKLEDAETGLLYMILLYTVGMVSTAMLGGWLSDRAGKRKVFVVWSGVIIAVAAILLAIWPTWPVAMVAAVLFGAGFGIYLAVDTAVVTQVLPAAADRAKDIGVINIAPSVSQALGPVLAAPVVAFLGGYPTLFVLTAVTSLAGALAVLKIRSVA
ncbi:MFS family permease [Actinoplanes tereljensis]|uniref:MFS transporter n=1 Tax=Paractinoplanes tereljensis TaxID=571912 RepID=A0A919TUG9_9ACTN|nr:MFS transporter [Actinoplanes tereljensis]GIF20962.1 MFS transporter [Actinoplanes tereljensis]